MHNQAVSYAVQHRDRFLQELVEFLGIPSVSAQAEHAADMQRAATWLAEHLRGLGLTNVQTSPTPGHPVVTGEWMAAGAERPTLLIYGHYDVQPPEPLELWISDPFQASVRETMLYGRGVSDDKGQLFIHLKAIEAYLATSGRLPINLKLLLEGEEEIGGINLEAFIKAHRRQLACDVALISDSAMFSIDRPAITYGLRGISYMQIEVEGPDHDLHSGAYGGAVYNPIQALAEMIVKMKDAEGRVTIPGFYDRVRPLPDEERKRIERVPFDKANFCREAGVLDTWGEAGYTLAEQLVSRPTLECNGIWGGYIGQGSKTVLPSKAYAKISMRLVPDQSSEEVARLFSDYVLSIAPSQVKVSVRDLHGGLPALIDPNLPEMEAASRALERSFGTRPVFTRSGGSIPAVADMKKHLGVPTILLGFGLPDDNAHSPNEKLHLPTFYKGIEASIFFMDELARVK
ncbi:MAG: dipeptidase [Thermoflexales bacterium]|nr:dipeptidase [Thermoflexales bacterium]